MFGVLQSLRGMGEPVQNPALGAGGPPIVKKVVMEQGAPHQFTDMLPEPQSPGDSKGVEGHGNRMVGDTPIVVGDIGQFLKTPGRVNGLSQG